MTADERKQRPVFSGVLQYFPDALLEVARCSWAATQQHHPDKPMHWDRSKSPDEADALMRHLIDAGKVDADGIRHSAKVAWRALALLQKELEAAKARMMTYDEDLCHPVTCHCGRKVTHGPCKMASADQCPFGPRADSTGHP